MLEIKRRDLRQKILDYRGKRVAQGEESGLVCWNVRACIRSPAAVAFCGSDISSKARAGRLIDLQYVLSERVAGYGERLARLSFDQLSRYGNLAKFESRLGNAAENQLAHLLP
jgi:hypothetical protein